MNETNSTKTDLKVVVIKRSEWGMHAMRNHDGTKCCLGFVAEQLGVLPSKTLNVGYPSGLLSTDKSYFPEWLLETGSHDHDVGKAAMINDNEYLTREEKEVQLKALFMKHDIDLQFVD